MNEDKNVCEHPDQLKGKPGDCSEQQKKKCHGVEPVEKRIPKEVCRNPDQLKGAPGTCSAEQVKKCHGDVKKHPCE